MLIFRRWWGLSHLNIDFLMRKLICTFCAPISSLLNSIDLQYSTKSSPLISIIVLLTNSLPLWMLLMLLIQFPLLGWCAYPQLLWVLAASNSELTHLVRNICLGIRAHTPHHCVAAQGIIDRDVTAGLFNRLVADDTEVFLQELVFLTRLFPTSSTASLSPYRFPLRTFPQHDTHRRIPNSALLLGRERRAILLKSGRNLFGNVFIIILVPISLNSSIIMESREVRVEGL